MDDHAALAREAVERAGAYLGDRFAAGDLDADFRAGDVKTRADRGAERRVVETIRSAAPDHAIVAEESGEHPGRADRRWVVDALDGTNNFAAGLPTFGAAATLIDDRGPLATAVHVPVPGDLYVARRGEEVTYNGTPVTAAEGPDLPPDHATVAVVLGAPVLESPELHAAYESLVTDIEETAKRAIRTWAPVVYWGLLARGRLGGFVSFYPDEREQAAGSLLAREADCSEHSDGPLTVFARDDRTRDVLRDAIS
jgi:myo-inositol-1(or 4)-monophosphatase